MPSNSGCAVQDNGLTCGGDKNMLINLNESSTEYKFE